MYIFILMKGRIQLKNKYNIYIYMSEYILYLVIIVIIIIYFIIKFINKKVNYKLISSYISTRNYPLQSQKSIFFVKGLPFMKKDALKI